jgi:hypothetical protein
LNVYNVCSISNAYFLDVFRILSSQSSPSWLYPICVSDFRFIMAFFQLSVSPPEKTNAPSLDSSSESSIPVTPKEVPRHMTSDPERAQEKAPEWKPQRQEFLVMITTAIISLMVALDATILVSVLPVCIISNGPILSYTF